MNLTLYINRSEPDPRLALVVSQSDMTKRPMPILTLGDQVNLTIIGVDGGGAVSADSGAAGYAPRLALGLKGHESLVATSDFDDVVGPPKGWSCALDLDDDELLMYVRSSLRPELTLSFLTVHADTGRSQWLSVPVTVEDGVGIDEVDEADTGEEENDPTVVSVRSDITTHAEARAMVTAGLTIPQRYDFLFGGWEAWTLRTKAATDEDDDDTLYLQPDDYDAVTNNVVFAKTPVS